MSAIHIGIQLWHIDLVAGEHTSQLRRCAGFSHKGLKCIVQCYVTKRCPVLNLELETSNGPQALHWRRREHRDESSLDTAVFLIQLLGNSKAALVFSSALFERFKGDEYNAGIWAIGETIDRQSRKSHC